MIVARECSGRGSEATMALNTGTTLRRRPDQDRRYNRSFQATACRRATSAGCRVPEALALHPSAPESPKPQRLPASPPAPGHAHSRAGCLPATPVEQCTGTRAPGRFAQSCRVQYRAGRRDVPIALRSSRIPAAVAGEIAARRVPDCRAWHSIWWRWIRSNTTFGALPDSATMRRPRSLPKSCSTVSDRASGRDSPGLHCVPMRPSRARAPPAPRHRRHLPPGATPRTGR